MTLKGAGSGILGILPQARLISLQEQLVRLLRGFDDHSATLLCLAIFASLHTDLQLKTESLSSQQLESCPKSASTLIPGIYATACQFFGTKKANKTVDLVVLGAIRSCSSACNTELTQTVDSLNLVGEILDVVENNEKVLWVQKNPEKVQKLYQKATLPDLNLGIRLAMFGVISSLVSPHSIPQHLVRVVEGLIQRTVIDESFDKVIRAYIGSFDRPFLLSQFSRVLDASIDRKRSADATMLELKGLKSLVRYLTEAAKTSSTTRQVLLIAMSSSEYQDSIQIFCSNKSSSAKCVTRHGAYDQCPTQADLYLWSLQRDICNLLLVIALHVSCEEVGLDFPLTAHLLQRATALPVISSPCKDLHVPPKLHLYRFPATNDCHSLPLCRANQDWRKVLKEDLDRDTAFRHELIIRSVSNICGDLEARCNDVEQPLVAEQQRCKDLQIQLELCEQNCIKLEDEAKEHSNVLDGLKAERDTLIYRLNLAEVTAQKATEACKTVQTHLDSAHEEAADASRTSSEQLYQEELAHATTIAAKDALLEAEMLKAGSLESRIGQLLDALSSAQKDASTAQEQASSTLFAVHKGKEDLEHQTRVADQALGQLESMKYEVDSVHMAMDRQRSTNESQVRMLQGTVDRISKNYEADMSAKDAELAWQRSCHEGVVELLRSEIDTARSETFRLVAQHELRVAELLHRVQQLEKEVDMRAKEFAEAQDLSGKLMALMGKRPDDSTPYAAHIGLSDDRDHDHSRQMGRTPMSEHDDIHAAPLPSFGSGLPRTDEWTSKRPRVQRDTQAASLHMDTSATGLESLTSPHGGLMKIKRYVLGEIGVNERSGLVSGIAQQADSELEIGLKHDRGEAAESWDIPDELSHEASFEGHGIITSTSDH